jgi:putative membrane protein
MRECPVQWFQRGCAPMGFLIRVLINALAIYVATALVSGIRVSSTGTLLLAALVLAVINAAVRPIMIILTLPLTVITLGLFLLVLNAVCLWLVTLIVPGVEVQSFGSAFLGALIISAVSWLLTRLIR